MKGRYTRTFLLPKIRSLDLEPVTDLETLFRLAPQWEVKSLTLPVSAESGEFELMVEYDRSETQALFSGKAEISDDGRRVKVTLSVLEKSVVFLSEMETLPSGGYRFFFDISGVPEPQGPDLREYDLWARSILDYMRIRASRAIGKRIWKWFLDRFWLRMSPSGKRMVFFIVVGEGLSLVLLIGLLLWWRFFSTP